jgi:hypothetical protein
MHGVYHVKIVYVQHAKLVSNYKNTKLKRLKINASIWHNKQCAVFAVF